MITTTTVLEKACQAAQMAGAVGIDTEFVWSRTYYPTLGVVQMGYPDGQAELIDALAIQDWKPFATLMGDSDTVKILHDAQQDLTILKRICGTCPRNIFDTQRSAGFVGLSSTISLRDLLKVRLKVHLAKTETQSDWLARPLTEAQAKYAMEDVAYSTRVMDAILKEADVLGRREWIQSEMRYYENEAIYKEVDPDAEMPKVRGSGALTHQQRNLLCSLGAWREHTARRRNLPRNFILSDEAIVALTKRPPTSSAAIRPMKGLSEKTLQHNRKKIWVAIERGMAGDLKPLPEGKHKGTSADSGYEARVDLALAFIKGMCLSAKIDPALIGNRSEMNAFILEADNMDPSRHRMMQGWRADFCGRKLLALLNGKGSVSIDVKTGLPKWDVLM